MFSSSNSKPRSGVFESVLGKSLHLKGSITSKGSIRLDGTIEGDVSSEAEIMVGEGATVNADLTAASITIGGTVNGNVRCSGRLELLPTARLKGDLSAGSLVISEGAIFTGNAQMAQPQSHPGKGTHEPPEPGPKK